MSAGKDEQAMATRGIYRWVSLVLAVCAISFPSVASAAQSSNDEMRSLHTIFSSLKALGSCQAIGYEVDVDAIGGKVDSLIKRLADSNVPEQAITQEMREASTEGERSLPQLTMPDLSQGDPRQAFNEVETVFSALQASCERLIKHPELSAHISRGPFQSQSQDKSFFGMFAYQADRGDTASMGALASFYAAGARPDPDHELEFMWYKRAADRRDRNGAARIAWAYFMGRGVTKVMVEAVKWSIISESLGYRSTERETIEAQAAAEQRTLGQERATAWLEAGAN